MNTVLEFLMNNWFELIVLFFLIRISHGINNLNYLNTRIHDDTGEIKTYAMGTHGIIGKIKDIIKIKIQKDIETETQALASEWAAKFKNKE